MVMEEVNADVLVIEELGIKIAQDVDIKHQRILNDVNLFSLLDLEIADIDKLCKNNNFLTVYSCRRYLHQASPSTHTNHLSTKTDFKGE